MDSNTDNEQAMLEEHDEFMRQVSESGVPLYLLRIYGEYSFNPKSNVNTQEIGPAPISESSPTPAV